MSLPLPDFITSARREARVSPDFLALTILTVFFLLGGWWLSGVGQKIKIEEGKVLCGNERSPST
jgi:hypothetical protein